MEEIRLSGRQSNGWGECVWCGEMLKPEDKDPYSDNCEFCQKWNELTQLVIKRKFHAEKMIKEAENEQNQKAIEYWRNKRDRYQTIHEIHEILIEALNVKKINLYGETY